MTGARRFLLCADDFALSDGVSEAIRRLAETRRLSGTAALVTVAGWSACRKDLPPLRSHIALGLHLNLTLGAPLGSMPCHAATGNLPSISDWIAKAWTGRIDLAEVEAEIDRQFDRFEEGAEAPPDYVDGHHHVHQLPGIRTALIRVLGRRYGSAGTPLVRLPGDRLLRLFRRGGPARTKALVVSLATAGARRSIRRLAAPTNDSFAGFSPFDRSLAYATELASFERAPGDRHLVMCHPGLPDAVLERLDPVSARRADEFTALMNDPGLPDRILHPAEYRRGDGTIDWQSVFAS